MTATVEQLGDLHGALAETLTVAIKEGVPVEDKETGKVFKAPAPAALLSVARQFLNDNKIEAKPAAGSRLGNLAKLMEPYGDDLPFPDISQAN